MWIKVSRGDSLLSRSTAPLESLQIVEYFVGSCIGRSWSFGESYPIEQPAAYDLTAFVDALMQNPFEYYTCRAMEERVGHHAIKKHPTPGGSVEGAMATSATILEM